jgi:predicted dehydrogenase
MTAMVRYPEGFVLKLTSTAANAHPGPLLTFYGTEGTLEYDGGSMKLYHEPRSESFVYSTRSWPAATVARFRELMNLNDKLSPVDGPTAAEPVEYRAPNDEDATRAHLRDWIRAVRGGGPPIEDVRFGVHAALVGHMCNVSYRGGKTARWDRKARRVVA